MSISEKEKQIEILWQEYESRKITQQAIEKALLFSRTITEILAYEEYLDQEREMEAYLVSAEIIWHLQDSVRTPEVVEQSKM